MQNGPQLWTRVLAACPPDAIVAGGAVRDFLMGVEPKDIDVFYPLANLGSVDPSLFQELEDETAEEYDGVEHVADVMRGDIEGYSVDLIAVDLSPWSAEALVATFDFGIARCWFDGEVRDTPEAEADRESGVVRCLLHDRLERAHRRFARFNRRHDGRFTFDAPPVPVPEISEEVAF